MSGVCGVPGCPHLKPCPTHRRSTRNGSTRQWRQLRPQILARDGWRCRECGAIAEHVDHVIAKANGGSDHPSNLQSLCSSCNLRKGAT
jgi:5-methylcytosine-specific restriction protein A